MSIYVVYIWWFNGLTQFNPIRIGCEIMFILVEFWWINLLDFLVPYKLHQQNTPDSYVNYPHVKWLNHLLTIYLWINPIYLEVIPIYYNRPSSPHVFLVDAQQTPSKKWRFRTMLERSKQVIPSADRHMLERVDCRQTKKQITVCPTYLSTQSFLKDVLWARKTVRNPSCRAKEDMERMWTFIFQEKLKAGDG